jgi:hypothetical protein
MSYTIFDSGESVLIFNLKGEILEELKPSIYSVQFNQMSGFSLLREAEHIAVPERCYGSAQKNVDRVLHSFLSREEPMGTLLSGISGSGKTLFTKLISNECVKRGIPVVLVNDSYDIDELSAFLGKIQQRCVVIFDEFEKTYPIGSKDEDRESEAGILRLLDGVLSTPKLFLLTCNETERLSKFLLNRPGRVRYHFEYDRLEDDVVKQYLTERGVAEEPSHEIFKLSKLIPKLSFDILRAIVDEHLTFPEDDIEHLFDLLNIEFIELDFGKTYVTDVKIGGLNFVELFDEINRTFNELNTFRVYEDTHREASLLQIYAQYHSNYSIQLNNYEFLYDVTETGFNCRTFIDSPMLKSLFSYLEVNYAKGFEDEDTETEFKNKALMCKKEKWIEFAKFVNEAKIDQLIPVEIELRSYRKF